MANEWAELPAGLNEAARGLVGALRAAKDAAGLSLAQLATHTHYSRASWERWLNGKRLVTPSALTGFARLTGLDGAALGALLERAALDGGPPPRAEAAPIAAPEAPAPRPNPSAAAAPATARAIAQLPLAVSDFTGRATQIETMLNALPRSGSGAAGQTPVVVVCGGGGVGKTTLAVHVAHQAAQHYPDGALYVDLRGVDANPRDPADVLASWLSALGEAPETVPASLDDRANRFRTLVRDKALLVLLDNAHDAAQIRPLIPASGRGALIVTSRAQLAHLPAAARIQLEPMTYSESLALLENVAGAHRIGREPKAAATVLDACAGLPLALRICAARLETRPSWSVQTLAERISNEHRRLDELSVGDLATRSSFDMSYALLSEEAEPAAISAARAFRLLGLTTFPDIGLQAAAALFGADLERAEFALETLVDVHLLESPSPERYRFHDLIALYAGERGATEPEEEQRAAISRLCSWYVYGCELAIGRLNVVQPFEAAGDLALRTPELEFADSAAALAWLDAEAAALTAVSRLAERHALHEIAAFHPNIMYPYADLRGRWDEFAETCAIALRAARTLGAENAEATALNGLGWVHYRKNETDPAMARFSQALEIFERVGRPIGEAMTLELMAHAASSAGDGERALDLQRRALDKTRLGADRHVVLVATGNLALDYAKMGRHREFFELSEEVVPEARSRSLTYIVAPMLEAAGELHLELGRVQEAVDALTESVELFTALGNQPSLADALEFLGNAYAAAGEQDRAVASWTEAVALFDACDPRRAEDLRERMPGSGSAAHRRS
ncbi:tetratricopeptide repeat protein [Actinospica sp.]|jgi:tetratricopeptide (TPR) repeat protein/transcriptional regulator with XRE-family HTH domain|uniref:tetratricopeptide repeat protein n=1 Tax=Actinospica sp. TaxID=1872142 RepID=UPI002BB7728D|nr:tetratricopeptide repeat protein [Actinospica sp.]HWG25129.1 tetratricopeptide repeat protein [Actinospica sp.]